MPSVSTVCSLFLISCWVVQGQRISQIKCSEYRAQTVLRARIVPLLINPEPIVIEKFNCSRTTNLIHGGEDSKLGEFPHQAILGWRKAGNPTEYDFICGGSLISERYVLTAGHCFKPGNPHIVRLGEYDLASDDVQQLDFEIDTIVKHPNYTFSRSYNDIALIKLKEPVTFTKFIRPACLWDGYDLNVTSVIATGFGYTEEGDHLSNKLRKVQLDFLDKQECSDQFDGLRSFKRGIQESQLCIGSIREGKDTCQGDSGGPVQVVTEPKGCTYHVIGVTSLGAACGIGRSPSIYTRVASYIDWIESVVWK